MIKLERGAKPDFLTNEKVEELTNVFLSTNKPVWNHDGIKKPLLKSSFNKCAYCECPLTTENNFMEVEHFEDKKHHPEKVIDWDNLLPACKKCNGSKSTHDVNAEPIINPYQDEPKEHLSMHRFRMRGKTEKGNTTIEAVRLNHSERLVYSRFLIGEKIAEHLITCWERFESYQSCGTTKNKNRLIQMVEGLLRECQPTSSYAASSATTLLTDSRYDELVIVMKRVGLWGQDLEDLHHCAASIVLDCTQ